MTIERRLEELGITLPPAPEPVASYVPFQRVGDLLFVSGQGPKRDGIFVYRGKVGKERTEEEGYDAAEICALNALAVVAAAAGSLDSVHRIIKLLGWVACVPEFERHPFVMNGASDLMTRVFGDAGRHARSAVGANALPFNITVEVEMIVELR
jgi:enamine deaminase RidA (YjgF/YER057c/UK114 family)